ncbi:MAG: hypothetical protein JNK64_02135 [Myxococcales bacterium]|nr:hypothetical protein [Myxococcales bacterium]
MSFPWLTVSSAPGGAARRVAIAQAELRDRAALLARLGFTPAAATARLVAAAAWDFDPPSAHGGPHRRPAELGDAAIAALVDDVFKRQRG